MAAGTVIYEKMSLIEKLAKIRAISNVVQKNKKGYNYTYADITSILAHVTAGMQKYEVSLIPHIVPGTSEAVRSTITKTKFDKTGKPYEQTIPEVLFKAEMIFKWVNNENTEDTIEVPWIVVGSQEDPSQAFGSGLTYCTRYFLCNYFQIAQPDSDVDAYRSKQKEAEASEDRAIAEGIIGQFDIMVKKYLSDNPEQKEDVKKFIGKFAKNSNYNTIKEPVLAAKMLNDFKENFIKEKKV